METELKFNYAKLRGRIKELFNTQEDFARALGIGRVSLSQRLNCKLEFTQAEINKSIELLDLDKLDIPEYFFNNNFPAHHNIGVLVHNR